MTETQSKINKLNYKLKIKKIMTINESIYMALSVSDASKVSPLLMGNPGSGKTTSVEYFAKANDMKMVLLRGSQSSPEEILGYEVNDGDENLRCGKMKIKVAKKICPKWYDKLLENSENGVRTLLFLDEITTASSFVQSALLQLIFGREIDNDYPLPEDTFVVAAGNYASNLSADFNLIPPLMNRFCIFNVSITKDDIKAFMSRYSDRQDVVSKLKLFDTTNSSKISSIDPSFVDTVKRTIESKLCEYVQSLISQGKFDPNYTEMSDIYQDQSTGSKLLGFLTPRTLGYYTSTSIFMYLKYGLDGVNSDTFQEMTSGLVGISLSGKSNGNNGSKKELLTNEFVKVVVNAAKQLDKRRVNSVSSTEEQLNRIITKLDSSGNKVTVDFLQSPELISMKKVFDSAISDREMRKLQSPIDTKLLMDCSDLIVKSVRNVMSDDRDKLREVAEDLSKGKSVDRSKINLERINGGIKSYNDSIKAYKSLSEFVSLGEFKYQSDLIKKITVDDKEILKRNRFRIDNIKKNLRSAGITMSELVETENI